MCVCVCRQIDQNRYELEPRWEVVLNNGEKIFMDDGEGEPASAWLRLRKYCSDNNLWITSMLFGFRSNVIYLPNNAEGYFFCRGALGSMGSDKTIDYFIVGALTNGILTTTKYRVPEMLEQETENRDPALYQDCLIVRSNI